MAKERLIPLSRITTKGAEIDSVAQERSNPNRAFGILIEANQYWLNLERFRRERERNKRYTYGDQWCDVIDTGDGEKMTEEKYIRQQGNVPMKNNLMRRLIKNVLGVYRSQSKEPTCVARDRDEQKIGETMSTILQCNMQLNRMNEVNARTMEEFLIGGLIVQRKWYGWRNDKLDCWTDYVNPNNFFIDSNMRDFRGWDVSMLGEIHDISWEDLCNEYAKTPQDVERLRQIYATARDRGYMSTFVNDFGYSNIQNLDFFVCSDDRLCRVIEVWRKESKCRYRCHDRNNGSIFKIEVEDYELMVVAENNDRIQRGMAQGMALEDIPIITAEWFIDTYWYCYCLTPMGDVLREYETPYKHKSHPYVYKAYPYIDGEIHSFASDVIDQQRYVNRLITMYDWIMRSSAKGLLLFPEDAKPDNYSWDEIAKEWTRFNGMIIYKPKSGAVPQQVSSNSTNIGISELLNLQLKFFEDISGVNGALQGKPGYSGTSAALYSQQTQNATTSLLDLLESFSNFVVDGAYKDVKNMQQYYDTKRVVNIAGKSGAKIIYEPDKIQDVEFDLSITESTATPAYRQIANDMLIQLWQAQAITTEMLLEHADVPYADELLQSLQSQKQQMAQGEQPQGVPQQLQQQMAQGADMNTVNLLYNSMVNGQS